MIQEGDYLYGRGTTDCLGHVAMLTDLFVQLAEKKPSLKRSIVAVFIACEENTIIPNVGVEELIKTGKLDFIKGGPVYWVDSADSQPCIGTAASQQWKLTAKGKVFHSGLPDKGINSIELANEALKIIQDRFYADFSAHPQEKAYNFSCPSTLKPTQIKCTEGGLNQIPSECWISGDIRMTPFYDLEDVKKAIQGYIKDLNENLHTIPTRGPSSKYELKSENLKGELKIEWLGEPFKGIACNIESAGFKALRDATQEVLGEVKPYSIGGSLPLVKELQDEGFDIQITGYGKSSVYHGYNEYVLLSDMKSATKIFAKIIQQLNQ